jgi:diacylglycerol O-acyltransferase / wax synthase
MDRMSGVDYLMLAIEDSSPGMYMHMAGLTTIDTAAAPEFGFERFRAFVHERMPLVPRLRRRLQMVPFGIDFPIWVDDPAFDPDNHIHRVGVPAPGGDRELSELVCSLQPYKLDRRRPLWEFWFIEGLADGRVGLYSKIHHAMFDGVAMMAQALYNTDPDLPVPPSPLRGAEAAEPERSGAELFGLGMVRLAGSPARAARLVGQSARQLATLASRREGLPMIRRSPRVFWNEPSTGAGAAWAFGSLPLEEVKRVGKHFGVTVNDVLVTVVAGALRAYLSDCAALPRTSLTAVVPASVRPGGMTSGSTVGNLVSGINVPIASDITDPVERLQVVHANLDKAKATMRAVRRHHVTGISELLTPALSSLLFSATSGLTAAGPVIANTAVTNVPGPTQPMYVAGAPVERVHPTLPMMGMGMGLAVIANSYLDRIEYGIPVARDLIPDPWPLVERMTHSFDELAAKAAPEASLRNISATTRRPRKGRPTELATHRQGRSGADGAEPAG